MKISLLIKKLEEIKSARGDMLVRFDTRGDFDEVSLLSVDEIFTRVDDPKTGEANLLPTGAFEVILS
jgi:hypothetical protein